LQLPVEIRHRIWNTVIEGYGTRRVKPMKKGNIFYSSNWQNAASDTVSLSETCRLIYVDVVGGSLFYKAKVFSFTPGLMLNYLWVVRALNLVVKSQVKSDHNFR
jgi:hypothetical protein